MKMIDIINQLIREGYNVKFFKRKDGGYQITSINGKSYRAKEGNMRAREILGVQLKESALRQRKKASEQSKEIRTARKKGKKIKKIDKELEKKIRRVQRLYRIKDIKGKPTKKKVRERLKELGYEETMKALEESERYARGLAYNENINDIITKLERLEKLTGTSYQRYIELIDNNRDKITEDMVFRIQYLMSSYGNEEIDENEFIAQLENLLTFNK